MADTDHRRFRWRETNLLGEGNRIDRFLYRLLLYLGFMCSPSAHPLGICTHCARRRSR